MRVAWREDVRGEEQKEVQEAAGTLEQCNEEAGSVRVLDLCSGSSPWPRGLSDCSCNTSSCLDREEVPDEGTVRVQGDRPC